MSANQTRLMMLTGLLACAGATSGCTYDEGLIIHNMSGTIIVPREAAVRDLACSCDDVNGDDVCDTAGSCPETTPPDTPGGIYQTPPDVRNIGPVYVGLFADIEEENVIANYPHPSVGPIFREGTQGDTYPYGGTTVGDLRFACFDALTCKVTSGRWESYDAIVSWYNEVLGQPIVDADNRTVDNGEYFQQTCFDLMEVTSDEEVMLLPNDRDGDEKITLADLDFVENADGDFEGQFKLWQQDFWWDTEAQEKSNCEPGIDCPTFKVWAFMDAPSESDSSFLTCNDSDFEGFEVEEYNSDFFGGRVHANVLNQPDAYITEGDWVANQYDDGGKLTDGFYEWQNVYDQPTIRLGYEVTR